MDIINIDDQLSEFGDRLRKLREKTPNFEIENEDGKTHHFTQEQIAEICHVSVPTVRKWENGITFPSAKNLAIICTLFECDSDYLLGFTPTERREIFDIMEATGFSKKSALKISNCNKKIEPANQSSKFEVEFCDEMNLSASGFIQFVDSFIASEECAKISSSISAVLDSFSKYNCLTKRQLGEYWYIQKRFNDFIEKYTDLKSMEKSSDEYFGEIAKR